jgi:RTX calcium-binding nonapeptide repeat (4 copies)
MTIKRAGLVAGAALLTAVLIIPNAQAATISVADETATLTANPGEVNDVRVTTSLSGLDVWNLNVSDAGAPLTPGPGCAATGTGVTCAAVNALIVWAGDRADTVALSDATGFPTTTMYGQGGADTLSVNSSVGSSPTLDGGNGDDTLLANMNDGGDVPTLRGGAGDDSLSLLHVDGGHAFGGGGDDEIVSGTRGGSTPLELDGEGGNDTYTFLLQDRVRPEALVPGPGFDTLDESSVTPDEFRPFVFDMTQCSAGCVEQVIGSGGDDQITGDGRTQIILGGDGNDTLDGGGGLDLISGDGGDDMIEARDGTLDTVGCGDGFDTVFADRFDLVSPECEATTRGGHPDV